MNESIKVFIVDKREPTLFMLNLYLDHLDNFEIVGNALAKDDFVERIKQSEADVVIYSWHLSKKGQAQIQQLKAEANSLAFISIRDGNFLPLEGVTNQTPETLVPTTSTMESLITSIERIAIKRESVVAENLHEVELSKAC